MSIWDEKRKQAAAKLAQRVQESADTKGFMGTYYGILIRELGIEEWFCKGEEAHIIDIIPYLTSKNHPDPAVKQDEWAYVLILGVHEGIGVGNQSFICPAVNFRKKCPICEERRGLMENEKLEYDDPKVKALEAKRKTIYNIICYDNDKEQAKGVQIWTVAHWNFERHIIELSKATPRGGGHVPFASPEKEGKSIAFRREGKGFQDTKYLGHRFVDRDYIIPDEILNSAKCLEDIICVPTYEELYEIFYAKKTEEKQEPSKPAPVEEEKKKKEEEVPPAVGRGNRLRRTAEDTKTEKKSTEDIPETIIKKCPMPNGKFGSDLDNYDNCKSCPVWDDCLAEAERLDAERKSAREQARLRRG